MSDNVIKVSVTSTKSQRVSVSSSKQATNITANSDTGRFWSQTSKNWAVSESIVDNEDYSSKYYANKSKESANTAKGYLESTREIHNNFASDASSYINELTELKETGTQEINEAVASGKDEINSTKTTILNDIEFVADGEKKEIQGLVDEEKEEIKDLANLIKENAQDIVSRTSFAMFDTVLKDHILTYEESKGLALQGTWVYKTAIAGERYGYPDFYAKVVQEYNEATGTEIVNGVKVKVHSNGHKFYDIANKSAIDSSFNSLGTAWYYGVDITNERVFLPRNNYFEQMTGITSEVSDSIEAGLPNITGAWTSSIINSYGGTDRTSGVFTTVNHGLAKIGNGNGWQANDLYFDASRSNPIYGKSNTVQPNAVKKLLYICVGNTVQDTSWVDVVTQVEGGVKDLEDKTNEGLNRLSNASNALRTTQITNCLLEVPQRIKVETVSSNGRLILKAGSIVSVSVNGTFEDVVITEDVNKGSTHLWTSDNSRDLLIAYVPSINELITFPIAHTFSQDTAPTTDKMLISQFAGWFDTTTNTVKYTYDGGTTWTICSLPFAYGNAGGTGWIGHLKQVFNGMGYIGSTIWVDKGVKYLVPNGRNEDGSLKNIEFTINKIVPNTLTYGAQDYYLSLNEYGETAIFTAKNVTKYNSDRNVVIDTYANIDRLWCFAGECTADVNNKITSFSIKQPFRAIDYSDKSEISGWSMPSSRYIDLTLGASGTQYIAPANGYYVVSINMTGSFSNIALFVNNSRRYTAYCAGVLPIGNTVSVKKGDVLTVGYSVESGTPTKNEFRFYYAVGSESEV